MKIAGLMVVLVAAGCAAPQRGLPEPSRDDMSRGGGVGGVGDDVDMTMSGGGTGGTGGGGSGGTGGSGGAGGNLDMIVVRDMTPPPPDMTRLADMAMCTVKPPVTGAPCSEFPQCGCAGTQNCDLDRSSSTSGMTICTASGTIALYNNCDPTQNGQCPKGASCIGRVCKPFCGSKADCPGANRYCGNVVDSKGNNVPGALVCSLNCNPLNPQDTTSGWSACGPNTNCAAFGTQAAPQSDCYGPANGSNAQGADCTPAPLTSNYGPCAPGYQCLGSTVSASCYKNCRVGTNSDCTSAGSGLTCTSFATKAYANGVEYGYCN